MQLAELAQRLAALDLTGASLQHRLAVSAAVETLKALAEPDPRKLAKNSAYGRMAPSDAPRWDACKPAEFKNVVALPVPPRTRWTRLYDLKGNLCASSCHFGAEGAWGWVLETVAHECGVSEDQISSLESDETQPYDCDDLVTVDGLPVYRLRHTAN
jgi:hypothetical protein